MTALLRAPAVCVVLAVSACGQSNPMTSPSTVVPSLTLSSISVAMGAAQSGSQPQKVQMLAAGLFSDPSAPFADTVRDLTSVATWQSSNPAVATVSATTGVLTVVQDGETTITATYQGKSGSKVLAFQNPSPWDY